MATNISQNLDQEAQDALAQIEKAQGVLAAVKAEKEQVKEKQKKELLAKRQKLTEDAQRFRSEALQAAQAQNYEKANDLRGYAESAEKAAKEIVIEGENQIDEIQEVAQDFQKGMSLSKIMFSLLSMMTVLYFISSYVNHVVQNSAKNISISIGAEWVHAMQTTQFWALAWLCGFGLLTMLFLPIGHFLNPRKNPEFDFTTKLFTECSTEFQIKVTLWLLLSLVFSWIMVFMHSPISNSLFAKLS